MKILTIAVLQAPGLLDVDLKSLSKPATITKSDVIKTIGYFVSLVLIFAAMFVVFVLAAQVPEPQINIIEKGEYNGTFNATNTVPSRI